MQAKINLVAFYTILRKEIGRFMRIWTQSLLPPVVTMSLYFIIFGNLIGSRIGSMDQVPYITYIAPGLIMMSVITSSYSNVTASFFLSKFQRSIEELLIAPVPNWVILVGYCFGGIARACVVGLLVTIVAMFFTHIHLYSLLVVITVVILTSALFSLAAFTNSMFAKKFDDIAYIPTFILTPLSYLGGVFYSIDLLPKFWHQVSLFNPILYMVNSFRFGILGISDVAVVKSLVVIVTCVITLFIINLNLLNRGVGLKE